MLAGEGYSKEDVLKCASCLISHPISFPSTCAWLFERTTRRGCMWLCGCVSSSCACRSTCYEVAAGAKGSDSCPGARYSALSAQINSEEAIDVVLVESYPGAGTMWDALKQSKFVPFHPSD